MVELDKDVFATILAYIQHPPTLHTLLLAFPHSHPLVLVVLDRLWQLPINLDSFSLRATTASNDVLDYLLTIPTGETEPLAHRLRQLVVRLEDESLASRDQPQPAPASVLALRSRIVDLLGSSTNLRTFDYHGYPGLQLDSTILEPLAKLNRLERLAVDCSRCSSAQGVPASGADYAAPGELSATFDADIWDIDAFTTGVGPSLSSLELRHINYTVFGGMKTKIDEFRTYNKLRDLKLDITEGVWNWGGGGSPAMGASSEFEFPFLGFPSVRRLELVVCDKTVFAAQTGPLNMVDYRLLDEFRLDVRSSIGWMDFEEIHLFEALPPLDMNALRLLEINDNVNNNARNFWDSDDEEDVTEEDNENDQDENEEAPDADQEDDNDFSDKLAGYSKWDREGRLYPGLVSVFLASVSLGGLPNLTHLWVNERVLMLEDLSVQELLVSPESREAVTYAEALRRILSRLTSLRVGFGRVDATDVEAILELCDATKLTQFGFEWNWQSYGEAEIISRQLLESLARFPLLADVHILFPRPGTETNELATTDPRTLKDVSALFSCNKTIVTVGIGHSVVWERGSPPVLVCDGKHGLPNAAVARFFQAGFMLNGIEDDVAPESDNCTPERPELGEEIEQLRDVLRAILV